MDVQYAHGSWPNLHERRARTSCIDLRRRSGLAVVQHFFNENRIRQAASSWALRNFASTNPVNTRNTERFRQAVVKQQGIQFPLVELQTQCEMLRALIHKTAWR